MTDAVHRELELPAAPATVWRSLTDPDRLTEWLADEAILDLRPGGDARFRIGDQRRTGWIEEVSPPPDETSPASPGRLSDRPATRPQDGTAEDDERSDCARLTFWWAQDSEPASRVELVLTPTSRGTTRLRVVETRPLEILDLVGIPLPGQGSTHPGPALVAA